MGGSINQLDTADEDLTGDSAVENANETAGYVV
jgi:hypothetical protein